MAKTDIKSYQISNITTLLFLFGEYFYVQNLERRFLYMNENEFLILLQAKLDEAKSKGNINSDIDKIQNQIDILKVQAEIDKESIAKIVKQIESVLGQEITISNINIDQNKTIKDAQQLGNKTGKHFNQSLSHELSKSNNAINSFKKSLLNAGKSSSEIDNIVDKVKSLRVQIDSLGFHESSNGFLNVDVSGLDELGNKVKITQRLVQDLQTTDWKVSNTSTSIISTKEIEKINSAFADYTAKLAQFKSTNNNILSGLSAPLSDFESKLEGLRNGSTTIDDVKNSFKNLDAESSKILQNFTAQFNKADAAIRQIATGEEAIRNLRAEFKGLDNAPKEISTELNKLTTGLNKIKEIESEEGRTSNWSASYREWEDAVKSLTAKLGVLKKEQANVASTQIFKISDLKEAQIPYMTKVSNTIEKQMNEIQKMANAKGWLNFDVSGVEEADGKIKKLALTVTEAEGAIKKLTFQRAKLQGKGKAQAGLMQVGDIQVIKTAVQAHEELNQKVSEIQRLMDNGTGASKYQNHIQSLTNDFKKYGTSTEQAIEQTKSLQQILDSMKGLSGQELVNMANKFEQEFKSVKISLEVAKSSYDRFMQPVSKEKASSLINRINEFLTKNTKITKEARSQLEGYTQEINKGVNLNRWNDINSKFKETQNSMRGLNRLGASLKDQMTQAAQSFTQWLSVSSAVMLVLNQLRKMPQEVYAIDTAMTELAKVSDTTTKRLSQSLEKSVETAKKYASTVDDVVSATADWSRLGYNIEDAERLAKIATIYKNVGDGIDISTANESLVSTLQGFKINAEEALHIIDAFNEVANTEAIDSAGIGEALKRSASSMYAAGNTLEETIGLVTAANAVVQDPESIGTAYKTISMRIRGAKTEMEELGLETDGMVESTASLQEEILALSGVDIMKDKNTFKSTYQILDELSMKWANLTDIQQASITELIAGKRQGNIVSALMSNFDTARRATETAINSEGSALKEQATYLSSLEAKIQQFEAAFQSLSNTVVDSDLLKSIVDFGTNSVSSLEGITKALQTVNSLWGNTDGLFGAIGAASGLLMSKNGIGKILSLQW